MNTTKLQAMIEAELAQVQVRLVSGVGESSMCSLEKTHEMTRAMKFLEGQQQGFHGALNIVRTDGDEKSLLKFLDDARRQSEQMLESSVGTAVNWQEYLKGNLAALERVGEMITHD